MLIYRSRDADYGDMKRILVIGCPGSGKSYFSKKLHDISGLPLCHLDMLFWNKDRTNVTREVFLERLGKVLETDEWIIDGNYGFSMEMRLEKCDTVFFFDLPSEVCLDGVVQRRGKPRTDMPWNEADYPVDEEFIEFIRTFRKERYPIILERLAKFSDRDIYTFTSREQADEFLSELEKAK